MITECTKYPMYFTLGSKMLETILLPSPNSREAGSLAMFPSSAFPDNPIYLHFAVAGNLSGPLLTSFLDLHLRSIHSLLSHHLGPRENLEPSSFPETSKN